MQQAVHNLKIYWEFFKPFFSAKVYNVRLMFLGVNVIKMTKTNSYIKKE